MIQILFYCVIAFTVHNFHSVIFFEAHHDVLTKFSLACLAVNWVPVSLSSLA